MTNEEKIKAMPTDDLAAVLCYMQKDCGTCIASDYCHFGHTGFIDWLEKEAET